MIKASEPAPPDAAARIAAASPRAGGPIVGQRLMLPISQIAIGERIGFYNADHARSLGESMAAEGQRAPIQVRRNGNAAKLPWTLVAGLHRVRGAELVGLAEIDAIQVADKNSTETDLRRLELAENLSHRFRRPIERAIMMIAQGRLEEAIDHPGKVGETRQARGGRMKNSASVTMTEALPAPGGDTADSRSAVCGWRERTARAFGCSLSSLERHFRLHREIVEAMPDLAQALNDHPFGESLSCMMQIAGCKPAERRKVAEKLLEKPDWKSMDAVFAAIGDRASKGTRHDPPAKAMNAWSLCQPDEKRQLAIWMAGQDDVDFSTAIKINATLKARGLLP